MGKASWLFVTLLVTFYFAVLALEVPGQADAAVRLFQGPNATGAGQDIPPGTYRVSGKDISSAITDPVFSVKVALGFKVRFCQDAANPGESPKCEEFGAGTNNLKSVNFTLIKVWKETAAIAPVIVFEAPNWAGRSQVYLPGMYRSGRNEFGKINDNMAMSAVIAKGFRARFCVDEGILNARGGGECEEHGDGKHNLLFADSISFIEVTDLNDKSLPDDTMPVILYEDSSEGGKKQGFDVGTYLASFSEFGKILNDTASSITIKDGYRVLICPDEIPVDKCEELGPGKFNLRYKDTASYLKVWKVNK